MPYKNYLLIFCFSFAVFLALHFYFISAAYAYALNNAAKAGKIAEAGKNNNSDAAPYPLNLIRAYKKAVKYDHGYKAALYGKRAAGALGREGLSVLLPHISAQAGVSRYDFISPPPFYYSFASRTEGVSITQPLFSMKRIFEYSQYRTRQSIGNVKFESEKQDLIIRVAEVYLDVLAAKNFLDVLKSQKKAVRYELKQAKKLLSAGAGTKTGLYDARAKYYSVLSQIVGAESNLQNAYMKFKDVVGVSGRNLEPLRNHIPAAAPEPENLKYWVNVGIKHNPMLKYYRYNINYLQEEVKMDISSYLPSAGLQAGYTATNTQMLLKTPPLRYYSIGFQINIPIFDGGYAFAKTSKSDNMALQAKQEYEKEVFKNTRKLSRSYLGAKGDVVKIKMLQLALKSAKISLTGDRLGFKAGIKTIADVLNAIESVYNVKAKLLKAKYEYIMNLLDLYFNAGVLSEYDLGKINGWLRG